MIRIQQLKLPISHNSEDLRKKIQKTMRLKPQQPFSYEIFRQSLDARNKQDKKFVYTVDVYLDNEKSVIKRVNNKNVTLTKRMEYTFPNPGTEVLKHPPVIAGSGPAGLFCAYMLAKHGYRPVVLERGDEAKKRVRRVKEFWETGKLCTNSNVQFGEGGAGTFSDGKLNTLVKDPAGRNKEVLRIFVEAGAPEEILYVQKPHLGTDVLIDIVESMRHQIEAWGGRFLFEHQMTDLKIENGSLKSITVNDEEEQETQVLVAAVGHSARDTFEMFQKKGLYMQPKSFAVGVRVEHLQKDMNFALYGEEENSYLGAASYKLTHTCQNGRGVYTFCMCPGGYVVNASSEEGRLAINGMSYQARDSRNANSALIVTVTPDDFPSEDVLAGVEFQRRLEEAAYKLADGKIPVQLFEDFQKNRISTRWGRVTSEMKGAHEFANVRQMLPAYIGDSVEEGILAFDHKIQGFAAKDCVISAVESRTSSPVKILRNEEMISNIEGIYPCGEGAGYAGGITSAAMDGVKVAEAIAKKYVNFQ